MPLGSSAILDSNLSFVEGDRWDETPEIALTEAGVPPTDNAVTAVMQFRKTIDSPVVEVELNNTNGGIVITDANGWLFQLPQQALPLKAGSYVWEFKTTDASASGRPKTWLRGTIQVLKPIIR